MYSLVGIDGNAFSIMAYVERAMSECGFTLKQREEYRKNAMSDDYQHLLSVSMEYVDKCNEHFCIK
ncbi:MAG: hypothetical protein ACI37Z_05240 [Candidatus Gastranaerophilaceae bacterium]